MADLCADGYIEAPRALPHGGHPGERTPSMAAPAILYLFSLHKRLLAAAMKHGCAVVPGAT
nr:unnamed protein product [Digitaria exilis]